MVQRTFSSRNYYVGCRKGGFMPLDINGYQKDAQKPKCGVCTLGDIVLHRFSKRTPLTYEQPVLSAQF